MRAEPEVVVVQGVPFGGSLGTQGVTSATAPQAQVRPTTSSSSGQKQETKCRDPIFALLLYANVVSILCVAIIKGPDAMQANSDEVDDFTGFIVAATILCILSFGSSGLGLLILMCIPETLIKTSLIMVVVMTGLWTIFAFIGGSVWGGFIGLFFFAITVCYAYVAWSRIPFATVNLVTAVTAVQRHWGVILVAFFLVVLACLWSITWTVALSGVFDGVFACDANGNNCGSPNYGLLFLLLLSYFFTHQVLQNCVQVTVAGTVGTWWFEPSQSYNGCSAAVTQSFVRTITTSFGSVCFGSLIVAILHALKMLAYTARQYDDGGVLACIAECLLSCLQSIVEYFNKWAFVYVGVYGYGYVEASRNVFTLFKNRGWEAIITDDLITNTLLLISVLVGLIMGTLGLVIEVSSDLFEEAGSDAKASAFGLGFVIGLVICSITMSTIAGATNTIIVLFAERPAEFQQNYPELSQRMRTTWAQIYPGIL